jgi:NAD-dependent deacetylase
MDRQERQDHRKKQMDDLVNLLKSAGNVVVFTGAGVSTLSGIPDFRGKNGVYAQGKIDAYKGFDINGFLEDPAYYYRHAKNFIYTMHEKQPGIVHTECARLEWLGIVRSVITQNIDMLHQKAGSKKVIEVHGSPRTHHCLDCGRVYLYEQIVEIVHRDEVPVCEDCGGIVKPDVVFFGEMLPERAMERAHDEASRADLMLILGSSLAVHPAASIPLTTLNCGGKIAIVNEMETYLDEYAVYRAEDLEACFRRVVEEV